MGNLLQVISVEDKSIQGGLYRFRGTLLRNNSPTIYIQDISGRTNTLSVLFRPTLIGEGKGKGEKGIHIFSGGHLGPILRLLPNARLN